MPKISVTSKLDGIRSWSLQALDTCPGSIESPGVLVDACRGCYATTGNYRFANVRAPREFNRTDWERFQWVDDMVQELERDRYFRTPWCKHWLPTRMHKFPKFALVLQAMQALPNVMVRPSSDSIVGIFTPDLHGSVIVPDSRVNPDMVTLCRAYENDGKCNGCRACYDKSVPVIAYPAHGKTMAKVIRLKQI